MANTVGYNNNKRESKCGAFRASAIYDFAADAGAQGVLGMMTFDQDIVITNAFLYTLTGVTSSGSATLEVGISGDTAGIIAQGAKTVWDTAGKLKGPASSAYRVPAGTAIDLKIATADLTAGKLLLVIEAVRPVAA